MISAAGLELQVPGFFLSPGGGRDPLAQGPGYPLSFGGGGGGCVHGVKPPTASVHSYFSGPCLAAKWVVKPLPGGPTHPLPRRAEEARG